MTMVVINWLQRLMWLSFTSNGCFLRLVQIYISVCTTSYPSFQQSLVQAVAWLQVQSVSRLAITTKNSELRAIVRSMTQPAAGTWFSIFSFALGPNRRLTSSKVSFLSCAWSNSAKLKTGNSASQIGKVASTSTKSVHSFVLTLFWFSWAAISLKKTRGKKTWAMGWSGRI